MKITREQYEADIRRAKTEAHDAGYADGYYDAIENRRKDSADPLTFTPNPHRVDQ